MIITGVPVTVRIWYTSIVDIKEPIPNSNIPILLKFTEFYSLLKY